MAGEQVVEKPFVDEEHPFAHLHVHTEFSLLDGLSKIDKLVAHAGSLGMKSLAITDHGTMFGVINFYKACNTAGIKPIIGVEAYLARRDMHVHDTTERQPYHLLLLAKDDTGYKNLLQIASNAQLEGFYGKPRVDREFLAAHAQGVICTSGCLAAEIPRMVADGRDRDAQRTIGWYQDVFGKENFFLELQQHDIPILYDLNKWLYENQHYANAPLLATNDVHYVKQSDSDAHDTLLCIQTNALKSETKRMKMTDPSYYLRSGAEMWEIFKEVPAALKNTIKVAEMCNLKLDSKGYHLPTFPVPEGYTAETYLRYLAERGLRWRYGAQADTPAVKGRLDYELGVIHKMGFDTYFLIVWDLTQFARHADIWWNVRGSGAGSVAAFSLGITSIDPIENNLIFERFLNPGRVSMPDIDVDFPDDRRMDMIDYTMKKYGSDKVAAIITFGTMKARAAIKDVARALDYPLTMVTELTKLIPQIPSRPVTLADCLGDDPEKAVPMLKDKYNSDPAIKNLLDTALTVEGVARNAGTHAAGVIIGDRPLVEYLPLHRPTGDDTNLQQVTQFPMEVCESIGLLKVDFLGLSTLTIMRKACELIERYHAISFDMSNIPYRPDPDDPENTRKVSELFDLIGQGETTGVFQLESAGMKRMLTEMRPRTFGHIIAAIALYRPGPMALIPTYIRRMHGEEEVIYHHEKLIPILDETYGICVYQEQIQQIAAQLFGYSLGDADLMRRAVSKKKIKDLQVHKQIFRDRGPDNDITIEVAEKIFDEIEYFAAYGFNKCVTYNTEIIDAETGKLVKIGDLATGKTHITHTITCDTDTLRLRAGEITEVMANGIKPVYRLTTRLGRQIEATANHPFYTFGGWRLLGDLAVGEKIAVRRPMPDMPDGNKSWPEEKVIALRRSLARGQKSLPDEVFELSNEQLQPILAVFQEKSRKQSRARDYLVAEHCIVSEQLAPQLHESYLRLGIMTRISPLRGRFRALPHQIPVALEFLNNQTADIEGDIFWDEIASIDYIGEQPTYDLTVPGTHNFVANDIIVHNSHAADYAVLTCQTAYLKAHYPAEYYTALLSVQRDVMEDVILFTSDCRRLGIPIWPPNVNASELDFAIETTPDGNRGIRYGLGAVKNAGEKFVEQVITARNDGGPFRDLTDFAQRVDLRGQKRGMESLIKVGALDELGDRDEMILGLERITSFSQAYHHAIEVGQMSLFGGATNTQDTLQLQHLNDEQKTPTRERLRWEKDLIGLYVSQHPLNAVMGTIQHLPNIAYSESLKKEAEQMNGKPVTIAGLIVGVRQITTKKNETMAIISVEDIEGTIDGVLFPRTWTQYNPLIREDALVILRGKADSSRGDMQIIIDSVSQQFDITTAAVENDMPLDYGYVVAPVNQALAHESGPDLPENVPPSLEAFEPSFPDADPGETALWDAYFEEDEATEPLPPVRLISIRIQRTKDPLKDQYLIKRIHGLLIERPGSDHFRFVLAGPPRNVEVKFEQCTHYDDELERLITGVVGPGAITIEPYLPNKETRR